MGRETALFLAEKGFSVYAGTRTPSKLLEIECDNIHLLKLDITDSKSIQKAIDEIGKIDNRYIGQQCRIWLGIYRRSVR